MPLKNRSNQYYNVEMFKQSLGYQHDVNIKTKNTKTSKMYAKINSTVSLDEQDEGESSPTATTDSSSSHHVGGGREQQQTSKEIFTFKFIVIGDSGVGKSSIVSRYTQSQFCETLPHTLGIEFANKELKVDDHNVNIQIWDTAGQERFRAVTRSYYRGSAAAILVYDITRRQTYIHLSDWVSDVKSHSTCNTKLILIGNKLDLAKQRQVSYEEARQFAEDNDMMYIETSAKTNDNVDEAFFQLARKIVQSIDCGIIDEKNAEACGISLPLHIPSTSENEPSHINGCQC